MKYGDHVIYFCLPGEVGSKNNQSLIAPAIVTRPWQNSSALNIRVLFDGIEVGSVSSCLRAENATQAVEGRKWATEGDIDGWAKKLGKMPIDFSSGYVGSVIAEWAKEEIAAAGAIADKQPE